MLFWHLGRRLLAESLQDERAPYGKRILATVSRELTVEFGQSLKPPLKIDNGKIP
ncbi:MAG: hypothetical protein FJY97_06955 [candidate division Zixibacteria bacterium]|nr:hypothetical protein [candidate division Zixibacteria bacterium]